MTAQAPVKAHKRAGARRITAKTAAAVQLIVKQGYTQRAAAERVGMNEKSLSRALAKPHVAEYLEKEKLQLLNEVATLKGVAKSLAIQTGLELMQNAKSEAVKARMVEFFAGESQKASVNVQVNNHVTTGKGYEFLPPDAEVIDIKPGDSESGQDAGSGDSQSPASPEDSQE